MLIYQNTDYFLVWKHRGLATTLGDQESLLSFFSYSENKLNDIIAGSNTSLDEYKDQNKDLEIEQIQQRIHQHYTTPSRTKCEDLEELVHHQKAHFSQEQEFGLLNRLDNATGGFLYFAKTPEVMASYKDLQKNKHIKKTYITQVTGNPFFSSPEKIITIDMPIMHHAFDEKKMIVVKTPSDEKKGRGKLLLATTKLTFLTTQADNSSTRVQVEIIKGIRHQIRVHLASIGATILGDTLYNNKAKTEDLQLWSLGFDSI